MRLSRLGSNGKAKHRPEPAGAEEQQEQLEQPDVEMDAYLAALAPAGDNEVTDPGPRFGNAQAYQVRLDEVADGKLRQLANERQLPPLALLQDWVKQRLDWELRGRR